MKIGLLMVHPGLRIALSRLIVLFFNPCKSVVAQPVVLVLSCVLLCPGCRSSGRPTWVQFPDKKKPADGLHLSAVGRAGSLEQAEKRASQGVKEQLQKRLLETLRNRKNAQKKSSLLTMDDNKKTLRRIVGEPAGLHTESVWSSSDEREHAALASVSLSEVALAVASQIVDYDTQSQRRFNIAHKLNRDQPYLAILNLLGALSYKMQAQEQRVYLGALHQAKAPEASEPSLQALYNGTKTLISQLQLYPAKGQGLAVRADAKNVVLVLGVDRVTKDKRVPAGSMPIRFDLPKPQNKTYRSRSNAIGMASTQLEQVQQFAGNHVRISATIDAPAVFSQAGLDATDIRFAELVRILKAPQAVFDITVNQSKALRVALVIAETRLGKFRKQSRLVEQLGQRLSQAGYNLISLDEMNVEIPSNPTPTAMAQRFSQAADILVFGAVEAKVAKKVGSLVFVHARAHLMAVRTKHYRLLFEIKPSTKSPGYDAPSAALRALSSLSSNVMESLSKAF